MNLRRLSSSFTFRAVLVPALALTSIGMIAGADDPATKPGDAPRAPETKPAQPEAPKAPDAKPADKPAEKPAEKPTLTGTMYEGIYYADFNGKPVEFPEAVGKPMIIEMWATWCGPCRKQREVMHQLSAKYPEIVFVAASVDAGGASAVRIYMAEHKAPADSKVRDVMATVQLRNKASQFDKSNGIPKLAFVNKRGQMFEVTGSQDPKFTEAMIKNLLK